MIERIPVSRKDIQAQAEHMLTSMHVPQNDASIIVDTMLNAEISGMESHGLMRLKPYLDRIKRGLVDPNPTIRTVVDGAVARIDGGNGLGPVVMMKATETAIELAGRYGVGVVTVNHSNHFGMASYYSRRIAEAGCIGFVASSAGPTMAPYGGMDLLLGTNPFSVAFSGKSQTFCADMATSAAAKGKIRIYEKKGQPIPIGWALDQNGNDTTDPTEAIHGILLPMAGHKGYALAMAVDAVCALLSGAYLSCESASVFSSKQEANTGHFAAAIDISRFLSIEEFQQRSQAWFDRLKTSHPRTGYQIMIPGEPEDKKRAAATDMLYVLSETMNTIQNCWQPASD